MTTLLKSGTLHAAEGDWVFCNRQGQPCRSFRTAFERAVCQAGIQDFTLCDLRYTFASRLAMAAVALPRVTKLEKIPATFAAVPAAHTGADIQVLD